MISGVASADRGNPLFAFAIWTNSFILSVSRSSIDADKFIVASNGPVLIYSFSSRYLIKDA